eukprot:Sspe_Gene.21214::Locus_7914_Transcript_1_1_Confidence_1.000_Length_2111::g.21214::m.21214
MGCGQSKRPSYHSLHQNEDLQSTRPSKATADDNSIHVKKKKTMDVTIDVTAVSAGSDEHSPRFCESTNFSPTSGMWKPKSVTRLMELQQKRSTICASPRAVEELEEKPSSSAMSPRRLHRRRRFSSIMVPFADSVRALLESGKQKDLPLEDDSVESRLHSLFSLLSQVNHNTSGRIKLQDLNEGLRRMGLQYSEEEVERMFQLTDTNDSGSIEFEEFKHFFHHLASDLKPCADDEPLPNPLEDVLNARRQGEQAKRRRSYACGTRPIKGYEFDSLQGHKSRIKCIAHAPNQPLFAASDRESQTISLYHSLTGEHLRLYRNHQDTVMFLAISPQKKHLASCSRDCVLVIWDLAVGLVIQELPHPGVITCCAFTPDGRNVVTGCQDNICRKFHTTRGTLLGMTSRPPNADKGVIVSLAVQPTGRTFSISRSRESLVRVINMDTFVQVNELSGHQGMVWSVDYSHDGSKLVSNCEQIVKVWNPWLGSCLATYPVTKVQETENADPNSIWTTCAFCPSDFGHLIAAVCSSCSIYIMHSTEGSILLTLFTKAPVYCMSSSRESYDLVCGDEYGNIYRLRLK